MLDVDEECCQIGRIGKTCDLAAHRTDQKALRLLGRLIDIEHGIVTKGLVNGRAGHAGIAGHTMVSLDPQPALRIDTQAIGTRISIALNIAHQIGAPRLEIGITGQNEDFPCKLRCQRRVALFRPFNDVTMPRSEEHTSELQSLKIISYAVFCLKKK